MNQLHAVIKAIETEENISLVVAQADGTDWHTLVIDNVETNAHLQQGKAVILMFKESAVSIAKHVSGLLSIRNRLDCIISDIRTGTVLSEIWLNHKGHIMISVITTNAVKELTLQKGDNVEALIKTTDISLIQPEV